MAIGLSAPNQVKDVPFDVNQVINQISPYSSITTDPVSLISELTGEFLIDTGSVCTISSGYQDSPAIASDGTNYIAVWQDGRHGLSYDIYGTRVRPDGTIIDQASFPISTAVNHQLYPSVASGGSNYLVVWEDYRNNNTISDIYGTRVSKQGVVIDSFGFPISTANGKQCQPDVAFDGTDYLVVWRDERSGRSNIYGARVNQAGVVLDPNGIVISAVARSSANPSVAFDGLNYLTVWDDDRTLFSNYIYGTMISRQGIVFDSLGFPISTVADARRAGVAYDGSNYLVVWEDWRGGRGDIYGARISQSGDVLDSTGIPICVGFNYQWEPSVAFSGLNYLVTWEDYRNGNTDIYGARVDTTGRVLDTTGIAIGTGSSDAYEPEVASDGINYVVVWQDWFVGQDPSIYGARVTTGGAVQDSRIPISVAANYQQHPSVAFDSTNYLVVWDDNRNVTSLDIYGSLIDQTGVIKGQSGIPISVAQNEQSYPSVTSNGIDYFVVWQDYRSGNQWDIYGARINSDGAVFEIADIPVSTATGDQNYPAVVFGDTNFLAVWQDRRGSSWDIYGARISPTGAVIDANGFPISCATNDQTSPSVAFDGNNYFVVWMDKRNGSYTNLYGTRISQDGVVLDTNGIRIPILPIMQEFPAVAFDGTNYLVVWDDYRYGAQNADIYGSRVTQTGVVLDSFGIFISHAPNRQLIPSIAFDGTNYMIVWQDNRSGIDYDIYGAKLNPAGRVLVRYRISTQSGDQSYPTLAHGATSPTRGGVSDEFLIAYSGWTDFIHNRYFNTNRIWGKFVSSCVIGIVEQDPKIIIQGGSLLEVYPNPARSYLAIRIPQTADRQMIKIFDVSGTLVKEEKVASAQSHKQEIRISLKGINPGIYFLKVGKETEKFLVTR